MYNNYNPYYQPYRPQMEQPIQQPMQPQTFIQQPRNSVLQGEQVDSIEVVKSMKIPLDGSVSYYPLTSGDMIITKQLAPDGTSKILTYKLALNDDETDAQKVKYATVDDLDNAIKKLDFEALEEEIENLKKQIREMKKK